jgi:hypothetical protein
MSASEKQALSAGFLVLFRKAKISSTQRKGE